jgi:HK97 family phage prohead protease
MLANSPEHYDALRARLPDDVKILLTSDGLKLCRGARGELEMAPGPAQLHQIEVKRAREGASRVIYGYATRYLKCHDGDSGGVEAFSRGCFGRALASQKAVRLLMDHDEKKLVATTADRLKLSSDDDGLLFICDLPNTQEGDAAWDRLGHKGYSDMSIGYHVVSDRKINIDGIEVRLIDDVNLNEISMVKKGAVPMAIAVGGDAHDIEKRVKHIGAGLAKRSEDQLRDRMRKMVLGWSDYCTGALR